LLALVGLKNSLQPFSIVFKPLLHDIAKYEGELRELANNAALVEILGTVRLLWVPTRVKTAGFLIAFGYPSRVAVVTPGSLCWYWY
jgi:hypothetical protein